MHPGFCLVFHRRGVHAGWVAARYEPRWQVVLAEGQEVAVRPDQVLYCWEEALAADEPAARLRSRLPLLEREAAAHDMAALHATLPAEQCLSPDALLARGLPGETDPWRRAGFVLALLRAGELFRFSAEGFAPRTASEVQRKRAHEAQKQERQRRQSLAARWRKELEAGRWSHGEEPDAAQFLEQVRLLLAKGPRADCWRMLGGALGLEAPLSEAARQRLRGWLHTAGVWRGWPDIWLMWGDVAGSFPGAVTERARLLGAQGLSVTGRADFRGVPTYSIDPPGTGDFDDACSVLGEAGGGLLVAVHVAEPNRALAPDDPVFEEAARRMGTVYTPQFNVPMFPAPLAEDRFSLRQGEDREALTFRFLLSPGGAALAGIEPSVVRVTDNLDYAGAEALLAGELPWANLARAAGRLAAEREARGANRGPRAQVMVDARDADRIRLVRVDRSGAASRLVETLAVLCNEAAGAYCQTHRLPAIYRTQAAPAPDGLTDRGRRPAARFSLRGGRHAGLAAERYVQVTSPIRRFADLVMQRQLAGHLTDGEPTYREQAQLEEWLRRAEERMATHAAVERRIADYWKRRYLAGQVGAVLPGEVRRGDGGRLAVWLTDVELTVEARLPGKTEEGWQGPFRLREVDPEAEAALVEAL